MSHTAGAWSLGKPHALHCGGVHISNAYTYSAQGVCDFYVLMCSVG